MKRRFLYPILLVLISIIPLLTLLHPGLPITHDGQDHVARIANFYQSLSEGNIIPRWAGNLNWGYGHPILMFLYPMSSYVGSLFHFLGFSFVDSVKLVFASAFIVSGLTMYLWLKEVLADKEGKGEMAAFMGAMLYMFAPYRFVDLYVRGAIGEHMAFVFPPLILYFMLKLSQTSPQPSPKRRGGISIYIVGGALSLAGLILSHNAIVLMFLPILMLYALYLLFQHKEKKKILISFLIVLFLGFGLAAFFWLPAFAEGKYTLRDIVTSEDYAGRFVVIKDFLYGAWSYGGSSLLSKQIGLVQWGFVLAGILLAIARLKSLKVAKEASGKTQTVLLIGLLGIFFGSLLIMTNVSKLIWDTVSILQKFQFPWRFLSVTVFAAAAIGAIVFEKAPAKYRTALLVVVVGLLLIVNNQFWHAKDYLQKPESFFSGIYNSTTDTGESSPIWSIRFMEKRPLGHIQVIEGNAKITEEKRTSTEHLYEIQSTGKARIRENTLFFPGWHVSVDGKEVDVQFQDPNHRGVMTFFVEPGSHEVTVFFTETKLRYIANTISLISLLLLLFIGILNGRKKYFTF